MTNRAGSELLKMSSDGQDIEQRVTFSSPVNAMTQDPSGKLWVVCDGNSGKMYELDGKRLSILQSKRVEQLQRIYYTIHCRNRFG